MKQGNTQPRPDRACKDKGRLSMGNRLKSEEVRSANYRSFENAREYVRSLGLRNQSEWSAYVNSGLPKDIPRNPSGYYDGKGWIDWGDWLGVPSNGVATLAWTKEAYRSFKEAREFVRRLRLRNQSEWTNYAKRGMPNDIPDNPSDYYAGTGWIDWNDWLGR